MNMVYVAGFLILAMLVLAACYLVGWGLFLVAILGCALALAFTLATSGR